MTPARTRDRSHGRHLAARYLVALILAVADAASGTAHENLVGSLITIACWMIAAGSLAGLAALAVSHVRFRLRRRPGRRAPRVVPGQVLALGRGERELYHLSDEAWAIVEGRDGGRS